MEIRNTVTPQQSFGMAFRNISDGAKEALRARLKADDVGKYKELLNSQVNNKNVDIYLYSVDGLESTKLGANVYPKGGFGNIRAQLLEESWPHILRNPLKFIELTCKKADKMSAEIDKLKAKGIDNIG